MSAADLHNLLSQVHGNMDAFLMLLMFAGFVLVIPAALIFNGTRGRKIQ